MNILFLMDPLNTVIMEKDTSFILMWGAHQKGHKVFFLPDGGITRKNGKASFHVTEVTPQKIPESPFVTHESSVLSENDAHIIFIRNDPPFDNQYLHNTWLLDLLPPAIKIINSPSGIRTVNEKIWATQFTSLIPPTLVGRYKNELQKFLGEYPEVIAKPTDAFGGQSVFLIKEDDSNVPVILETLTHHGTKDIILQRFIPESAQGDKRVLLLNGEPLTAVLRMHSENDHRNNFFSGGKPQPAEINQRDTEIINTLKPHLQKLGLYFVGIDILGDYLIEVNVTSPTCLQEANRLYGKQFEDKVIEFAEGLRPPH